MTSFRDVRLIGVDWATDDCKRGVAVVDSVDDTTSIVDLSACSSRLTALHAIGTAISGTTAPSVIAVDAPLGWPAGLSQALSHHEAGGYLEVHANEMFSRETDRFIQETLKKKPLEVGANLIARTAHSANQFLNTLRRELSCAMPLLWSPDEVVKLGVIEVYPAATRIAVGNLSMSEILGLPPDEPAVSNPHVRDALWCAIAALHFIRGECYPPSDERSSRREGWIWVRRIAATRENSSRRRTRGAINSGQV